MFEEKLVPVETIYVDPAFAEVTPTEAAPAYNVFPLTHVRTVSAEEADRLRNEQRDAVPPIVIVLGKDEQSIGGVRQHALAKEQADARTQHVRRLAIAGTISHAAFLEKVEARKALPRRILARALGWLGIRHSSPAREVKLEEAPVPEIALEDVAA